MRQELEGHHNLPEDFAATWHGTWSGQRCVILANGPSLQSATDLERIDCPVIGINRSYRRHLSDVHIVVDKLHVRNYGHLLPNLVPDALRLTRYNAPGCLTPRRLHYVKWHKSGGSLLPDIADVGWIALGAGMVALQVAVWLGSPEIIFCGLDLRRPMEHFYDEPPWMLDHMRIYGATSLDRQKEYLRAVKPKLDRCGIRVISTTMDAGENVLKKKEFNAIWRP